MNLQTLSVILIIIILPITLLLSAYTKTQIDTLALQTRMRTQLKNATYDAVVAFQLNTVENEFSTVSDSMRRDVSAAIQSFMTNLAGNMGMSGATENALKPYIPAIVFTLYDGYYIYAPSKSTIIDNNGIEQTTYEHVLKPYIYYTVRYVTKNIDVIINYSLDNYIVVTGNVGDEGYVTKAGYLEFTDGNIIKENIKKGKDNTSGESLLENNLERNLPVTTVVFKDVEVKNNETPNRSSIKSIGTFSRDVARVNITNLHTDYIYKYTVKEGDKDVEYSKVVDITDRLTNGKVIKDTGIFKKPEQLTINQYVRDGRLTLNNGIIPLSRDIIYDRTSLMADKNFHKTYEGENHEIQHVYSPDNPENYTIGFYIEPSTNAYYVPADSAKKYYEEAKDFTAWVTANLGSLTPEDAVKADGSKYEEFKNKSYSIFKISKTNDPEKEESDFNDHREDVIKLSIKDNLAQAIASYSENSEKLGPTSSFQLPVLSDTEWHRILTNVCFITFVQGMQVGTKLFNDYCIVTSTRNKEYVSPESIYYINLKEGEGYGYYHKLNCDRLYNENGDNEIVGYRNSEFDKKTYEVKEETVNKDGTIKYDDKVLYYYMHTYFTKEDEKNYQNDNERNEDKGHVYEACYYCMVTKAGDSIKNLEEGTGVNAENKRKTLYTAYYTAMAREKYNFYKTNSYFRTDGT